MELNAETHSTTNFDPLRAFKRATKQQPQIKTDPAEAESVSVLCSYKLRRQQVKHAQIAWCPLWLSEKVLVDYLCLEGKKVRVVGIDDYEHPVRLGEPEGLDSREILDLPAELTGPGFFAPE